MVFGMATTKITITLQDSQLEEIRALVAAGEATSVSAFVQHSVGVLRTVLAVLREARRATRDGAARVRLLVGAQRRARRDVGADAASGAPAADARIGGGRRHGGLSRQAARTIAAGCRGVRSRVASVFSACRRRAPSAPRPFCGAPAVGLFGYAAGRRGRARARCARAARARGRSGRPAVLGAPGAGSPGGQAWLAGASVRRLAPPSFSGKLAAQELARRAADCELRLFVDSTGPTSRKTLAASLDSGSAVVAIDRPQSWRELIDDGAARIVAPDAQALARALAELLEDERGARARRARGRAFARRGWRSARAPRSSRACSNARSASGGDERARRALAGLSRAQRPAERRSAPRRGARTAVALGDEAHAGGAHRSLTRWIDDSSPFKVAASAATSPAGTSSPLTPCSGQSSIPPVALAMTGRPAASASI